MNYHTRKRNNCKYQSVCFKILDLREIMRSVYSADCAEPKNRVESLFMGNQKVSGVLGLIVLLVVVVMVLALRKPKPMPGELPGADVTAVLAKGRSYLMEPRWLCRKMGAQKTRHTSS